MNIPDTIKILATTTDTVTIRKLENDIARMFLSPILIISSVLNLWGRYFILHEDLLVISIDSIVLLCSGIELELFSRKLKNEKIKEGLITTIFSFIIIFARFHFFYLIGSGVWIFSMSILLVTIFREYKAMTISITLTIIPLLIVTAFEHIDITKPENIAYLGQIAVILLLILMLFFVQKTIVARSQLLTKQYAETLKEKQKFKITLKSVADGVITVNQQDIIEFINPTAQQLIGFSNDEALKKPFDSVFKIINEYTKEKVKSPIELVFEKKHTIEITDHTLLVSKEGKEIPIEATIAPIIYKNGNISGTVIVFRDFSEKKEKQNHIEYLNYHDELTGLYNRRLFDEEIKRLDVKRNLPISLVYADVNGLKIINDAFGHENGDRIIIQTADVLKAVCRADDIIVRVGGDEFVILLPLTSNEAVDKLVLRLQEKIQQININNIHMSVSFGWDTKNIEKKSILEVLKNAEDSMYQKKILHNSSTRNGIINSILNTLGNKFPQEEAHSKRVSLLCKQMGKTYQLSNEEIKNLTTAGEFHDIGKIAIDEKILNKSEKLSTADWDQIKQHPEIGYRLLGASSKYNTIAECVLAHHERWDGLGYPKGLKGDAINWNARVINLVASYDAMTCYRPYRNALNKEDAINEIKKNAGSQFDPAIAKVFVTEVLGAVW